MNERSFLREAFAAHEAGEERKAEALLLEGLNHYSRRILDAYNGCQKSDLPLVVLALRLHAKGNLEALGVGLKETVDALEEIISMVVIHN